MKKIIGFALAAVLAGAAFAEGTAQFGWQKGAAANAARSEFYSKVSTFKTDAEREAYFAANDVGGEGPYSDKEHIDVESLLARNLVTQEQADKIKADAAKKHEAISAAYKNADFDNMTKSQITELYQNLHK